MKKYLKVLQLELEHERYETTIFMDVIMALSRVEEQSWPLILLDFMLPTLSGMEVLRTKLALTAEIQETY
ncbi:hypothetical protein [Halalkalibacter sp. APA_J-10(15)]|uniref:hypothetical protein n=1 Tax=Halalkalibacter sp. APA_J-10(15) TaxID=2933805 RepID=UPI001FF1FE9D|nr:hypothetical protein [Halalkalibacter sp. APA_J-10(15)]